jgi:hypothetical protein
MSLGVKEFRRADSCKLYILRVRDNSGCGLERISFPTIVKEAASRRHGMCSVCMTDRDSKKCSKFYQCSECVRKDRTDRQFK